MKRAIVLMFVAACSSSNNDDDANATGAGGTTEQSTSGGDSATGGDAATGGISTGGAKTGGAKATGGKATASTGGTPGYPCASITYMCICSKGSLAMDMTCPSTKDPANNLCLMDLNATSPDGGTPGTCTIDCTAYCQTQSDKCVSVGTISC